VARGNGEQERLGKEQRRLDARLVDGHRHDAEVHVAVEDGLHDGRSEVLARVQLQQDVVRSAVREDGRQEEMRDGRNDADRDAMAEGGIFL
jgi:hypothetical protein